MAVIKSMPVRWANNQKQKASVVLLGHLESQGRKKDGGTADTTNTPVAHTMKGMDQIRINRVVSHL